LIDPGSRKMEEIGGFSAQSGVGGDHGQGVTSADVGRGAIFTADRSEKTLDVVDPASKSILTKTKLASGSDYVRYVAATNEVWVTEPHTSQIEIFSLPEHGLPEPHHTAIIKIANGPESLVIDGARGRAYANLWTDTTLAIDLHKRAAVAQWKNGCVGSRGLALDGARGFLFVGCKGGQAGDSKPERRTSTGRGEFGRRRRHNRICACIMRTCPARVAPRWLSSAFRRAETRLFSRQCLLRKVVIV